MTGCAACGNWDYREGIACPALEGKSVCMICCKKCEYHIKSKSFSFHSCGYYQAHPLKDYKSQIYKLNRQLEQKEKSMRYFYQNNKPWIAEKIEIEVRCLRADLWRLENEQKECKET